MEKEFILCAAIWINDGIYHDEQPVNIETGFVVTGRRHNNCYATISAISKLSVNETIGDLIKKLSKEDLRKHQGFITSTDRYVNRQEGFKIAIENNQIQYGLNAMDLNDQDNNILISENLY